MSMLSTQIAPSSASAALRVRVAAYLLFAVTLAITVVRGVEQAPQQFDYPHAFVSADVATAARTFASVGVFALRGVPVNNNPPIGKEDFYTHWPPLLPIVLSFFFRLFGASEQVAHLFMLGVQFVTALLIFQLGRVWLGAIAGALAGFFWLTLPVVVQFGHLVAQQSLVVMFLVAAVLALQMGRAYLAAALLFLGVFSGWETVLIVFGLVPVAIYQGGERRAAMIASAGALAGLVCVVSLYMIQSPHIAMDTLQTARYYMGISSTYSQIAASDRPVLTVGQQVSGLFWNHIWMIGALGLAALTLMLRARPEGMMILLPLAAPWVLWTVLMRTHTAIHHFQLLIAAPVVALALAWVSTIDLRRSLSPAAVWKTLIFVMLVGIQLLVLPHPVMKHDYSPQRLIQYSEDIREATEPGSIVMAPLISAVPIYYSQRHMVRDVDDDAIVSQELPKLCREFPGVPIYLAIPPFLAGKFAATLPTAHVIASTPQAVVLRMAGSN